MTRTYGRTPLPVLLPMGASPLEWVELDIDEVDDHRKILCAFQNHCVAYAESLGWKGYHCNGCKIERRLTIDEQKMDLDGLADMLQAIFWRLPVDKL